MHNDATASQDFWVEICAECIVKDSAVKMTPNLHRTGSINTVCSSFCEEFKVKSWLVQL